MFKKFFRKVRDVVKKAAPIAGIAALGMTGLGMLGGGAAGGGIGSLLPNLIGNFASSSAKAGAGAKGSGILGALQTGGKFLGGLGGSLIGPGGTGTTAGGIASTLIPAIGSYFAYKADKPQPVDTNGGEAYPRRQGMIRGPGGPKEDLIPAKLSNGEFVFTAKAVKNAGGPEAMYDMMNTLDPESSKGPRA
jgi:hypothetical protein